MSQEIQLGQLKYVLFGLLLFSGFMLGFNTLFNDMADAHSEDEYDFSQYSVLSDTTGTIESMREDTEQGQTESFLDKIEQAYALGLWGLDLIKIPLVLPGVINSVISDLVSIWGLPSFVATIGAGMIVVLLIFVILKATLKVG